MTLKELKRLLPFWQKTLNLCNWKITLKEGDGHLMTSTGVVGCNFFTPEERESTMFLLDGESEESLVHELLHLPLDGYKDATDRSYSVMHERAINDIAAALVKLAVANRTAVE